MCGLEHPVPLSQTNNFLAWCEANGELSATLIEEYADVDMVMTDVTYASDYEAKWKCRKCGYEWKAKISQRTMKDKPTGCLACKGQWRLSPTNNLAVWCADNGERGAQLLGEYVDPDKKATEVLKGSNKKALWKCGTCEHTWRATINHRTRRVSPTGCPKCTRARRASAKSG